MSRIRNLIKEVDPDVVEACKWMKPSDPSGAKLTFAMRASLPNPARLFNSSLKGKVRRAIVLHEGEDVDAVAFQLLIRVAVSLNTGGKQSYGSPSSAQ